MLWPLICKWFTRMKQNHSKCIFPLQIHLCLMSQLTTLCLLLVLLPSPLLGLNPIQRFTLLSGSAFLCFTMWQCPQRTLDDYNNFKEKMTFALRGSHGFGSVWLPTFLCNNVSLPFCCFYALVGFLWPQTVGFLWPQTVQLSHTILAEHE